VKYLIAQIVRYSHNNILVFSILLFLWLSVQFYLIKVYGGAVTAVDSPVYIEDANKLLNGSWPEGRTIWYIGYSLFLSIVFFLGGSIQEAVVAQMALSGIATICLYMLTFKITQDRLAAGLAVLFYLLWVKIHHWNVFIYSESLFTSFGIIAFTILVKSKTPWHYIFSVVLLLYTFFIRPSGFGFYVGLSFYFFSFVHFKQLNRWALASFALLMVAGSVLLLDKMLKDYILVESYARAEIIYPNISLGIVPPADLSLPSESFSPLIRLILFVLNNPLYFVKISLLKLGLFLGNVKPYFSLMHNLLIVVVLYPLYFFAIKGYKQLALIGRERYFIAGYVLAQALTVTLTTENWDGRFLVPVLPFIFILSAAGLVSLIPKSQAKDIDSVMV
jgi:hypothetical protein